MLRYRAQPDKAPIASADWTIAIRRAKPISVARRAGIEELYIVADNIPTDSMSRGNFVKGKAVSTIIKGVGVLPTVLIAALVSTPTAGADPKDDYIATIAQHGVLIINNRDVVEGITLGEQVCQHIRDGSSPMAERGILVRNGSSMDQSLWIVRAAQTNLCPDTAFDPGTTFGQP